MSWARFGSPCDYGRPHNAINDACGASCPGSDVYVYESDSGFRCCSCALLGDYVCSTENEMRAHLREHVKAGHHVRPSLLQERGDRMSWRDKDKDDDPAVILEARGVRATELALLCAWDGREQWVPQSVIHDDSEVWEPGQSGKLIVARWWAEKEGIE